VLGGDKSAKHRGTEGTERNTRGTERKRDFIRAIRWLTHTGREVSPSGLKPNSRIFCKIHYRAGSLREIYYLCVFAPLRLCVVFFPKQPYAVGGTAAGLLRLAKMPAVGVLD